MTRGLLLQKPKFFRGAEEQELKAKATQPKLSRGGTRERNKIATFAVMYHVHVNSFPVCYAMATDVEGSSRSTLLYYATWWLRNIKIQGGLSEKIHVFLAHSDPNKMYYKEFLTEEN